MLVRAAMKLALAFVLVAGVSCSVDPIGYAPSGFGSAYDDEDSRGLLTVALVVANGESGPFRAIEAKLLAALSQEDVQLVERQELQAVLDELRLAMANMTETGSVDALGELVPAEVFVFVEAKEPPQAIATGRQGTPDARPVAAAGRDETAEIHTEEASAPTIQCHLRVVETRTGVVLGQLSADPIELAEQIGPAVDLTKTSLARARH